MFSTLDPPTPEDLRVALRREIAALDTTKWRFIPEQPAAINAAEMVDLIGRYGDLEPDWCGWDKVIQNPDLIKTILSQTAVVAVREKGALVAFAAYNVRVYPYPIVLAQAIAVDTSLTEFMRAIASMGVPGHRALLSLGYETLISPSFEVGHKVDDVLLALVTLPLETQDFLKSESGDVLSHRKKLDIAQWLTQMEKMV